MVLVCPCMRISVDWLGAQAASDKCHSRVRHFGGVFAFPVVKRARIDSHRSQELGHGADQQLRRAHLCATLTTARHGFEPRACGGALPLRDPQSQRLGREPCALPHAQQNLAHALHSDVRCSHACFTVHANLSLLACRAGRVRQRPVSSTSFCRGRCL